MKSEITIFCSNEAELREFVQRLLSEPATASEVTINVPVTLDTAPRSTTLTETKPARKPRADAGKPRGPYKTTTTGADAGTTASSTPGTTPAAGAVGGDPVAAESPPATPTAAASASTTSAAPEQTVTPAQSAAPAAAEPTEADAKAAMGRINKTEGLGMPACIDFLETFGVNRITLLPKEKYAKFIKAADALVAAHKEKK